MGQVKGGVRMNTVIINGVNITEELEKLKELYNKQTKLLELYKKQIENITSFDYWKVLPIDVIQTKRWIDEIDKTEKKIRQLEKELEEMK